MPTASVGKRLPSIRLMEADLSAGFASAPAGFLKKIPEFVPYTFKELVDLELVEFSAMNAFNLLKYVAGVQRLCVPEDVFWYAFWNTDAEGDRLLIKGCSGTTCVVGWHEVAVAFGVNHADSEEFRAMKINNKNFSQYQPGQNLLETVETNAQRKLVNGQPYEEISYYKEAAPYGPTYTLMNVIAELFWCNGRSTRFMTPQVYAYMRSLHGFQTNWAKVILHNLRIEIVFLQKRARTAENTKPTHVIWAPIFTNILFAFRATIFSGTPLTHPDGWVAWTHMSKEGELDLAGLHAKFPDPIVHLNVIRDNCKLTDQIPLAEPVNGDSLAVAGTAPITSKLPARKRPRDDQDAIQVRTPANKDNGQSSTSPERTVRTRLTRNAATSLKQQLFEQSQKLADHNGQLAALKLELEITKAKCQLQKDRSAEPQLQKDLGQCRQQLADSQANLRKLETELKKAREDAGSWAANQETLKGCGTAKETKMSEAISDLQQRLQTEGKEVVRYKEALQAEMKKNADLDDQVSSLKGLIKDQKFISERAEKVQQALRSELSQVKTQLRMLQMAGK
ncbi:hypothetical protein R1sor_023759 [Riccia sorocarpa]|uniref:Uncharacterized protein n=1 Tax=Riccia sorocarpa TaxID=122646 RepID=A0ABD3GNP5_9MARC